MSAPADQVAAQVEAFVRGVVVPFERDERLGAHGPDESLVRELRELARAAGVLTPHLLPDTSHYSQRDTAKILIASGLSPLGPVAVNTASPDEGNMFLLGKAGTEVLRDRYLPSLVGGQRSAFLMTEPAEENGAGSDPGMLRTTAVRDGDHWIVEGRKAFITGVVGARLGIVIAMAPGGPTMFLFDLPDPAVIIEDVLDTIDSSMPGGHAVVRLDRLRIPDEQMLGEEGEGLKMAQLRLAPARLSHCMRWLGACLRAQEIATNYACRRMAFGKYLIEHEGVGFMLAENQIALQQARLMIDWCGDAIDAGGMAIRESSMTKVAVSEALMGVADRSVQVMGGLGVSGVTVVEQIFREIRAFRIYDGPTEVHKYSLAKGIHRHWRKNLNGVVRARLPVLAVGDKLGG